jgi:outer membrane murein-binding lipoprotein Lpp/tetrahydromethanopterin S-methyltransferase subunit G
MAEITGDVVKRVQVIEEKLDKVSASLDQLSMSVDQRFEQVDRRFEQVDRRFEQVDRRFEEVDRRFDAVDAAFLEQRQYTEFGYTKLLAKFTTLEARMDAGFEGLTAEVRTLGSSFNRLERKLDQFIDSRMPAAPPDGAAQPPQ